jgi:hypothetical protein
VSFLNYVTIKETTEIFAGIITHQKTINKNLKKIVAASEFNSLTSRSYTNAG